MKKLTDLERMELFKLAAEAAAEKSATMIGIDALIRSYYDEFKARYFEIKEKEEKEEKENTKVSRPSVYI